MIFHNICALLMLYNKNPCINCKFFINNEVSLKYSKCSLFPLICYSNPDDKNYYYCAVIRSNENKCGKDGKFWKRK